MKKILLFFFLVGCQGLPLTPVQSGGAGYLGGVASKVAFDKVKEALPKYTKILKLPPLEVCYLDENQQVNCTLNTCLEENCDKNYGDFDSWISHFSHNTYFINKDSLLNLISYLDTFCNYDEEESICEIQVKDYSNVDKVLIYEELDK